MLLIKMKYTFFVVTCPVLSLENGEVEYDLSKVFEGYPVDTLASFVCNEGFMLSGSNVTTCPTSGVWNLQIPVCKESNENNTVYIFLYLPN